jgi:hypothetical protein
MGHCGIADLDGDGNSDIVWHNNSSNETQIWFFDGDRIRRRATVLDQNGPVLVGPPWEIVGVSDVAPDGRSDIVWHNSSSNETQIWFMNPDSDNIRTRATVLDENGQVMSVGPPWNIVGAGDLDADGRSDIVWHNRSSNETQVWFMNGDRIRRRAFVLDENGQTVLIAPPWRIVGVAKSRLVWHNSSTNETQI